jgi:hypothetical protein
MAISIPAAAAAMLLASDNPSPSPWLVAVYVALVVFAVGCFVFILVAKR